MRNRKKSAVQTVEDLIKLVKEHGGEIQPSRLCSLAGFGEDVELYFDLLREGRNKKTLNVPSGKNASITIIGS